MEFSIEDYKWFGKCAILTNGKIELVVSLDFGPRVLRFCLTGFPNILHEQLPGADYLCTDDGWRVYGGLRLWFAPESEKTYWPDNALVEYEVKENELVLKQPLDGYLNIRKSMRIIFTDSADSVDFEFEIKNCGHEVLQGAPWAITAVKLDGVLHIPFAAETLNMFPGRFLSLWGTTSLADERLFFSDNELIIRPKSLDNYFKIGVSCPHGSVRYDVCGQSYIKEFEYFDKTLYPDNNVNIEVFCCKHLMEIESLGALQEIHPGETAIHRETWRISESKAD